MLTQEQMEQNKQRFLQLISSIDIEQADTEGLVNYLLTNDFFTAPASTIYHCNYEGGLCEHSLNVYDNLVKLTSLYCDGRYSNTTILIVSLLHDLAKVNFYEKYIANKKMYSPTGSKHDNQGNFDWFSEEAYKVADAEKRFLGGEHGFNSMMLVNSFIPLTYEESLAILHHHFNEEDGHILRDMTAICNKYPLVTLLHLADMASTYLTEAPKKS